MDKKMREITANIEIARNLFHNVTDEIDIDKAIMQMAYADRMLIAYQEFVKAEKEYKDFIGILD